MWQKKPAMQPDNSHIKKILPVVFMLLGMQALLPFITKPAGLIAGLLAGIWLFSKTGKICFSRFILFNSLIFFVYVISLFNSGDTFTVLQYLQRSLPFLAFPVFFILISGYPFTKQDFEQLTHVFYRTYFTATVIYSLIVLAYFFHLGCFTGGASYDLCMSFIRAYVWGFYGHPIYVSIYLMLAVIFSVYLYRKNLMNKTLLIIGNLILYGLLFYLSRKAVIVSGIVAMTYYVFRSVENGKLKTIFLVVMTILFASGVFLFPNTAKRFRELFNASTYVDKPDLKNSTQLRLAIYRCSVSLIPRAGLFGFGIGDVQDELNRCYMQINPEMVEGKDTYNTHNVFLNFLLATGYFGFAVFIFVLYMLYGIAFRLKDPLFAVVLIFFTLVFLTENVISRQNGILIFAFLINFYTFKFLIDSGRLCASGK